VEIALDVLQWNDEGLPIKEIRQKVEDKYSYIGPGTPTPPVE
jgi:hypothetical protein